MSQKEQCPGCDTELPADDVVRQKEHMEQKHPEIIAERLRSNGFTQLSDGSWHDDWSSD